MFVIDGTGIPDGTLVEKMATMQKNKALSNKGEEKYGLYVV
jgi:hypothetical protein